MKLTYLLIASLFLCVIWGATRINNLQDQVSNLTTRMDFQEFSTGLRRE